MVNERHNRYLRATELLASGNVKISEVRKFFNLSGAYSAVLYEMGLMDKKVKSWKGPMKVSSKLVTEILGNMKSYNKKHRSKSVDPAQLSLFEAETTYKNKCRSMNWIKKIIKW